MIKTAAYADPDLPIDEAIKLAQVDLDQQIAGLGIPDAAPSVPNGNTVRLSYDDTEQRLALVYLVRSVMDYVFSKTVPAGCYGNLLWQSKPVIAHDGDEVVVTMRLWVKPEELG